MIDTSKVYELEFEGIDHSDYPDYCDAYISAGKIDDRDLTDEEIEELNSDSMFVRTELENWLP